MSSVKKSVIFSESTVNYIKARSPSGDDIPWSEALNEAFKALKFLSQESLPSLTEEEWLMICNVYAGSIIHKFRFPLRIASDLMDYVNAISLEQVDDPTYAKLVEKIHAFSQVEQYAILDFVQKYWANSWEDCANWDETYAKIILL